VLDETDLQYKKEHRNNERIYVAAPEVSNTIWDRVKPFVNQIEITKENDQRVGIGYGSEGIWRPIGFSECWKICKYNPGGHFAPHYDGCLVKSSTLRSMKTFMLYLNDDFEGGCTNFLNEELRSKKDPSGIFRAEDKSIILKIKPTIGMGIIFNHQLYHEGEPISQGIKYIMRTEIMFSKEGQ